jgi:hypothetical protein
LVPVTLKKAYADGVAVDMDPLSLLAGWPPASPATVLRRQALGEDQTADAQPADSAPRTRRVMVLLPDRSDHAPVQCA